jgi:hypothetical protein
MSKNTPPDRPKPLTEERGLKPAKNPPPTPTTKPSKQEKKD